MSSKKLPLAIALLWIFVSTLCIFGTAYKWLHEDQLKEAERKKDVRFYLAKIIQTGPQKEALKTTYLAELLKLSIDHPIYWKLFDCKEAEKKLTACPLIKEAKIHLSDPTTVFVDYSIRQPYIELYNYENIALDREGYPFPLRPFFSPKKLTQIYCAFSEDFKIHWHTPIQNREIQLAFHILDLLSQDAYKDLFFVKRIDVSKAFAESYGAREIVLLIEEEVEQQKEGKKKRYLLPRLLRLSTKNFTQELGNYLELRQKLNGQEELFTLKEQVIDFRLAQLAFIIHKQPEKSVSDGVVSH